LGEGFSSENWFEGSQVSKARPGAPIGFDLGQAELFALSRKGLASVQHIKRGYYAVRCDKHACIQLLSEGKMPTKSKSYTKSSRCWPGYEPVPGKSEHEDGSCRKKPASRNDGEEVSREKARKKQISLGGKRAQQAQAKSPNAKERRSVSKRKAA
jgi:hypothetical protein